VNDYNLQKLKEYLQPILISIVPAGLVILHFVDLVDLAKQ